MGCCSSSPKAEGASRQQAAQTLPQPQKDVSPASIDDTKVHVNAVAECRSAEPQTKRSEDADAFKQMLFAATMDNEGGHSPHSPSTAVPIVTQPGPKLRNDAESDPRFIPHKLTGRYHAGELSAANDSSVNRYVPALGEQMFGRAIVGLVGQPGHMPKGYGVRKLNQDRGCVCYPVRKQQTAAMVAVFDGHGDYGHRVSEYAIVRLAELIQLHDGLETNPQNSLMEIFEQIDAETESLPALDTSESGSTACALYFREDRVWTANLGDSRCVAGVQIESASGAHLQACRLTVDQKPDSADEMARITALGGHVQLTEGESGRVFKDKSCEEGGLAVSRAIGDHSLSDVGVIARPVVTEHKISNDIKCLVLASDGLWEYVEDQAAINIVSQNASASRAAEALRTEAIAKWKARGGGYQDDITIIVMYLPFWWDRVATSEVAQSDQSEIASLSKKKVDAKHFDACLNSESSGDESSDDDLAAVMIAAAQKKSEG